MIERGLKLTVNLSGVVIIVGNYGSGKTEIAINLAAHARSSGVHVSVVDLDLVNPYFRVREARQLFDALGIDIILPASHLLKADLPVLVPQVAGAIGGDGDLQILDVGGDDVGATVLAALADAFRAFDGEVNMLQVVNPFRPNTDTVDGCLAVLASIEASSRLKVTGWIGNTNLIDETTAEEIAFGAEFMASLSEASGLPVAFITVPHNVAQDLGQMPFDWPVLEIQRQLVPPWADAVAMRPSKLTDHKE